MDKENQDNNRIKLTFEHKGIQYPIVIRNSAFFPWVNEEGNYDWFWWEEGNGGCDCNRSSFIKEEFPEFEEMDCGSLIELIDYEVI